MTWIGITKQSGGWFSTKGINAVDSGSNRETDALMQRGSLLLETRLSPEGRPQSLLKYQRSYPRPGSISLQVLPDGGIVFVTAQGDDLHHATLPGTSDGRTDVIRLSYSWDAPKRWAQLTLERPEDGFIQTAQLAPPCPVQVEDLRVMMTCPRRRKMDSNVLFAAVSDRIEPVGPMPGLTSRVPILTQTGEKPIGLLRRGDLVVTENGDLVPVLQVIRRIVPALGEFRPIRLRAPYFGLRRDVVVAPHQRLIFSNSQVEYQFDKESVLVAARHLVDSQSAHHANGPALVEYFHLLLPDHETILAGGTPMESLYIGRIRRKPEQLNASLLAKFDRSRLPEHGKPTHQALKSFEAKYLALSRIA